MAQRDDLLVWIDLEMTSLADVRKDTITEIAAAITDRELNLVAEGPNIIIKTDRKRFDEIDAETRAIHEASGIIDAAAESTISTSEAEQRILDFLSPYVSPKTAPLCGASMHMDRMFLYTHMPNLYAYLHHRNIDVSTLKELAKFWKPAVAAEWASQRGDKKHRALDDILRSIEELRFYRDNWLK